MYFGYNPKRMSNSQETHNALEIQLALRGSWPFIFYCCFSHSKYNCLGEFVLGLGTEIMIFVPFVSFEQSQIGGKPDFQGGHKKRRCIVGAQPQSLSFGILTAVE